MDYRLVERDAFPIIGTTFSVSYKDGENFRRIPELWQACRADGTIERLCALCPGKDVLGICLEMDHDQQMLTYVIAVEGTASTLDSELMTSTIPPATWAVFPSLGPLPHAVQDVWRHIFTSFFPDAGYQHADAPDFEAYPDGDTTACDYRCEVWIPVAKNA